MLLDGAQIGPADAITRLRQLKGALVVAYGALEDLIPLRQRFSGGEGVLYITEGTQSQAGVLGDGLLLFEGADYHLRIQRAALVNRGNQFQTYAARWVFEIVFQFQDITFNGRVTAGRR